MPGLPHQRTFKISDVTFSSEFDSGNLVHVEEVAGERRTFELYVVGDPRADSDSTSYR